MNDSLQIMSPLERWYVENQLHHIYVGNKVTWKGIDPTAQRFSSDDELLQFIGIVKSISWKKGISFPTYFGTVEIQYPARLRGHIETLQLPGHVELKGPVTTKQKKWLRATPPPHLIDALAVPVRAEGKPPTKRDLLQILASHRFAGDLEKQKSFVDERIAKKFEKKEYFHAASVWQEHQKLLFWIQELSIYEAELKRNLVGPALPSRTLSIQALNKIPTLLYRLNKQLLEPEDSFFLDKSGLGLDVAYVMAMLIQADRTNASGMYDSYKKFKDGGRQSKKTGLIRRLIGTAIAELKLQGNQKLTYLSVFQLLKKQGSAQEFPESGKIELWDHVDSADCTLKTFKNIVSEEKGKLDPR